MKKLKKIVLIFLFNLLILALVLLALEYIIYTCAVKEYKSFNPDVVKQFPYPKFFQSYHTYYSPHVIQFYNGVRPLLIRPFSLSPKHEKSPILLFGCSFTNGGSLLADNETFGVKLSEFTNRDVYNFGMCSCGIQHMLFIIRNFLDRFVNSSPPPEYAIYTYIPNHLQRLRFNIYPNLLFNGTMLQYKYKNNQLILLKKHFPFIYHLYTVKAIYHYFDLQMQKDVSKYNHDNFILANELFLASRTELKKRFPDIKFVILKYQFQDDDSMNEVPDMWDIIKSEGFIVLETEKLVGRKFKYRSKDTASDGYHPSPETWDMIVPKLSEKLEL